MATPELERLVARVDALERRLRALEGGRAAIGDLEEAAAPRAAAPAGGFTAVEVAALVGRMALGFGGAFLLRSATQAEILTPRWGVLLALLYALVWLAAAARAAARERRHSAVASAAMTVLIGLPLVWEATARFHFLGLAGSMAAVAAIFCAVVLVAWRRRLPALLWPAAAGIVPVAGALAVATGTYPPWLGLLLLTSTLLTWRARRWPRWRPVGTTSLVLFDLSLALFTGAALIASPMVLARALVPWQLLAVQTGTFVLASSPLLLRAARTGRIGRRDAVVAGVGTGLGLGGALAVAHATGAPAVVPGVAALALGFVGCALALAGLSSATRSTASLVGLGAGGLTVGVAGLLELFEGNAAVVAISIVALAAAAFTARRRQEPIGAWLGVSAALLALVGLVVSDGLLWGMRVLFGGTASAAPPSTVQVSSVAVAAACLAATPAISSRALTVGRSALLAVLAVCSGALLVGSLAGALPSALFLAPLRTGTIAALAILLATTGRLRALREGHVLVYPMLAAGGVKILLEELRAGDPTVLVASLVLYGTALLLAPRLAHKLAA